MTRDNIERGVQGETAVLNRLVQKGFEVLIPWGGRRRYDIAYYVTVEQGDSDTQVQTGDL